MNPRKMNLTFRYRFNPVGDLGARDKRGFSMPINPRIMKTEFKFYEIEDTVLCQDFPIDLRIEDMIECNLIYHNADYGKEIINEYYDRTVKVDCIKYYAFPNTNEPTRIVFIELL